MSNQILKGQIPDWISQHLPSCLESRFFQSSLGKIHYLTGGNGKPIIFIHGNPTWSFLWRKVIKNLDRSAHSFFAPDLLNLGFSDSLKGRQFSMENHCRALVEWLRELDLQEMTFVVQDWGGPIGLYTAAQLQERVQSLVILNTGIAAPEPPFKISKFHSFVNRPILPDIMFRLFGMPMYSLHKVQGDSSSIQGEVARAYRYPIRIKKRWDSALKFARMVPCRSDDAALPLFHEMESFCRNFTGPVEVVWGERDPILGRAVKKVRSVLPQAHYTLTNAGHFLQEEVPEEIAAAIMRVQ